MIQTYWRENKKPISVVKPKQDDTKVIILSTAQITNLEVVALPKSLNNTRNLFLIACYTGIRFSDCLQLISTKLDYSNGFAIAKIKTKKGKKYLEIAIPEKVVNILLNNQLYPICNGQINKNLRLISEVLGIDKDITFHDARHTWATTALKKGVNIMTVSKALGHSSIAITERYLHLADLERHREILKIWE